MVFGSRLAEESLVLQMLRGLRKTGHFMSRMQEEERRVRVEVDAFRKMREARDGPLAHGRTPEKRQLAWGRLLPGLMHHHRVSL